MPVLGPVRDSSTPTTEKKAISIGLSIRHRGLGQSIDSSTLSHQSFFTASFLIFKLKLKVKLELRAH
jgi:hypothetical protein